MGVGCKVNLGLNSQHLVIWADQVNLSRKTNISHRIQVVSQVVMYLGLLFKTAECEIYYNHSL